MVFNFGDFKIIVPKTVLYNGKEIDTLTKLSSIATTRKKQKSVPFKASNSVEIPKVALNVKTNVIKHLDQVINNVNAEIHDGEQLLKQLDEEKQKRQNKQEMKQ